MPLYDCISVYLSLPVFLVNAERRQPSAATCAVGNSSRRFSSTLSMFARAISVSCASPTSREMKQQRAVAVAGWNARSNIHPVGHMDMPKTLGCLIKWPIFYIGHFITSGRLSFLPALSLPGGRADFFCCL